MKNTNIVLLNKKYVFLKYYSGKIKIHNFYIFNGMDFFSKFVRLFINEIGFILGGLFWTKWYKNLKKGENVIFFDEVSIRRRLIKLINRYNDQCKLYLWNPVSSIRTKKNLSKLKCEICTFSRDDSLKYGYRYVGTFFVDKKYEKSNKKYDFIFVGKNKGRECRIDKFKTLIADKYSIFSKIVFVKKDYMKYDDYLSYLFESECVLEFIQNVENCETLRVMESLFYNKKLITENKSIINEPYYSPNNIFVYKNDTTIDEITVFMNLPFDSNICNKFKNQYSLDMLCKKIYGD